MLKQAKFTSSEQNEINEYLKNGKLWKFNGAIMYILHEVMGMDSSLIIGQINQSKGEFLLDEIMISGNFGKFDERFKGKHHKSKISNFWHATYRSLNLAGHFPPECIWFAIYWISQYFWRLKNGYK